MTIETDGIHIVPLGGFGQIGANCLTIEINRQIIIIDCGVIFPSEPSNGVDFYHPSFDYLIKREADIAALIITHGHEDHIGAVPFLLEKLNIPIYSDKYTLKIISSRLQEYGQNQNTVLKTIFPDNLYKIKGFSITPFNMPHSIIGNLGLLIEHSGYKLVHTGDYKLDANNENTASALLKKLNIITHKNGSVDLLITDSTGSLGTSQAGDEESVYFDINNIVSDAKGRVFVVIFSSNIIRIDHIGQVARQNRRKLVFSGKSVRNNFYRAKDTNNCDPFDDILISEKDAKNYNDSDLIIILSGTQGENRSALGRIAFSKHAHFTVKPDDIFIFSSRFIPGNELKISDAVNSILDKGATVFHNRNRKNVHVSGHGCLSEIKAVIKAIGPKYVLPSHGTREHLNSVCAAAKTMGLNSIVIKNGDQAIFNSNNVSVNKNIVPCKKTGRSNGRELSSKVIRERNLIGMKGFVYAGIILHPNRINSINHIEVVTTGVLNDKQKEQAYTLIKSKIIDSYNTYTQNKTVITAEETITRAIRKILKREFGQKPVIVVNINS